MTGNKYDMVKSIAKKIRIKIYDSVWIDEEEDVYMEKTNGIVEDCIDNLLKELVDNKIIKFL